MAPSFDSVVTSLLCAEDNTIFDENEFEDTFHHRNHRTQNYNHRFDDGDGVPLQSDECVALLLEKELQQFLCSDYLKRYQTGDLDFGARKEAVDWIGKVHAHFGFGPLCEYLAIQYLDRFLSAYELSGKAWMMQLLAVACLSIAAKMEETEVPLSLDLQVGDAKFVFEARTIQRMELLVLSTLGWRMQAVTPFSFIDYFLHKIKDDQIPVSTSIFPSIQLILSTTKGIDFLEFKPSEVAAAVAVSFVGETQTVNSDKAVSMLTQHVQKEKLLKCVQLIHDLSLINGSIKGARGSAPSVPQSPIGVLDAACLSYKSDDTQVKSCSNSSHSSPDPKRRKLNRPFEVEL